MQLKQKHLRLKQFIVPPLSLPPLHFHLIFFIGHTVAKYVAKRSNTDTDTCELYVITDRSRVYAAKAIQIGTTTIAYNASHNNRACLFSTTNTLKTQYTVVRGYFLSTTCLVPSPTHENTYNNRLYICVCIYCE